LHGATCFPGIRRSASESLIDQIVFLLTSVLGFLELRYLDSTGECRDSL